MICEHRFVKTTIPQYERCERCDTYHSLAPANPAEVYTEGYWSKQRPSVFEQVWNVDMATEGGVSKNRFVIEKIASERGAALDIGCAPGRLLYWLTWAARFHRVVGIDTSAHPNDIRIAGCFHGELLTGLFPTITVNSLSDSFDLITALDVLEHSPEPEAFLRECRRLLRPGGQVMLMLPLGDDLPQDSRFFVPEEHVYLHSKHHIGMLLEDSCLKSLEYSRWTLGHDLISARKA